MSQASGRRLRGGWTTTITLLRARVPRGSLTAREPSHVDTQLARHYLPEDVAHSLNGCGQLVAALLRRDGNEAEEITRRHIEEALPVPLQRTADGVA